MQTPPLPSLVPLGLLLGLLAGALPACGGSTDPHALAERGLRELNGGDAASAANDLSRALETLPPEGEDHLKAQVGLALALATIDPEEGRDRFVAYAEAHPARVEPELYRTVGEGMFKAGALTEGLNVVEQGVLRHPDDAELKQTFERLQQRAAKEADPEELKHLRSMGYVGGD
jgi:hypothetical protein